ncbi:MAG: fibrillarin-like rRNA/tRNA 2'-O-methyltransferase [Candidatus Jordarchaeum sp.]|uniref:fibrillarin-like rRNA/tRNA 2'-O-methyltransferase n=1 Tax=Candidatus Jordarchaeum sp. TaxID=2823881 RepID=UPI00404B9184
MIVEPHEKFKGIFLAVGDDGIKRLATRNISPGFQVYGEKLVNYKGNEFRLWEPYRSKLAASILKKIERVPLEERSKVLYLGAASGTTSSHVADIVGADGVVFCVEFSPRVMRELVRVCEGKRNMIPILADARFPEKYRMLVEYVDVVYSDVAQPEQAKLLADNSEMFLKSGGYIMLAIKAQSVDVTKEPSEVFKQETKVLTKKGFEIIQVLNLEPFDKAHAMVLAKFK